MRRVVRTARGPAPPVSVVVEADRGDDDDDDDSAHDGAGPSRLKGDTGGHGVCVCVCVCLDVRTGSQWIR